MTEKRRKIFQNVNNWKAIWSIDRNFGPKRLLIKKKEDREKYIKERDSDNKGDIYIHLKSMVRQ